LELKQYTNTVFNQDNRNSHMKLKLRLKVFDTEKNKVQSWWGEFPMTMTKPMQELFFFLLNPASLLKKQIIPN